MAFAADFFDEDMTEFAMVEFDWVCYDDERGETLAIFELKNRRWVPLRNSCIIRIMPDASVDYTKYPHPDVRVRVDIGEHEPVMLTLHPKLLN